MTTFPAFHSLSSQLSQTSEPSPPGSTPGLVGCFPQMIRLDGGLPSSQSASRVPTAYLCPLVYSAACGVPPSATTGQGRGCLVWLRPSPHHCPGHMKFIVREPREEGLVLASPPGQITLLRGHPAPVLYMTPVILPFHHSAAHGCNLSRSRHSLL